MNNVIFMGRLTADPDIRTSNTGTTFARFNFAVNRTFKKDGEPDADFFSCSVFGKQAENMQKCNIGKGTKLLIQGEVRNNNYKDKDGNMVYGTQILVNRYEFCESKGAAAPSQNADADGFITVPTDFSDELPFM